MVTYLNNKKRVPVFEYYHLLLFFNPDDYKPMAIYGAFGDKVLRAEVEFHQGVFSKVETSPVAGFEVLDDEDAQRFVRIIDLYLSDIVRAWTDFYVYRREISNEVIQRRIN
jgi:hypothetical protein